MTHPFHSTPPARGRSPRALAALACLWLGLGLGTATWANPTPDVAATPPAVAVAPAAAAAEEPERQPSPPIGAATQALFEHQRRSSAQQRPLGIPGPVAVENWERYLRSFKTEIPAQFDRQLKEPGTR